MSNPSVKFRYQIAIARSAILLATSAISSFLVAFSVVATPDQLGTASWYGEQFRGRPTASGESFNPDGLTAAHPYLPFGTRVRVIHQYSGTTVEVVINDRMASHNPRAIDLSQAAADQLGILQSGVAPVRVEVLE
ncbi:MAG: septal ring lytic transglycosylase RlpA family protein [Cyanobacteria bacterium P01_E01_bin.34]